MSLFEIILYRHSTEILIQSIIMCDVNMYLERFIENHIFVCHIPNVRFVGLFSLECQVLPHNESQYRVYITINLYFPILSFFIYTLF